MNPLGNDSQTFGGHKHHQKNVYPPFFKALEMLFLHLAVSVVLIFVSETAQNVAENSCLGFQNIFLQRF